MKKIMFLTALLISATVFSQGLGQMAFTAFNADGPSLELLNPNGDFNDGLNWGPASNLVGQSEGLDVFASPGTYTPVTNIVPVIFFDESYISVNEADGTATLSVSISELPATDATVLVSILSDESSAVAGENFEYSNETLTFTTTGSLTQEITIIIPNNSNASPDTLLALQLENSVNADLGNTTVSVVYILDDELHATTAANTLGVAFGASYEIEGNTPGSEIVAHDPETERLFVMNSSNALIEILDFSDPLNIESISSIDLTPYGVAGTSVAYKNGTVAATAIPTAVDGNGIIIFMDTDGVVLNTLEVGALPDMITFSPDGNSLLVANEGQPNSDYTVDPEGTVSIINLTGGIANLTQADVINLNFNTYDSQIQALRESGIRIFGPGATVSQDFEPEYITISEDSQTAWVTLQENNAVAVIDLSIPEITDVLPLGLKDHSLSENALDTSNEQDFIFMANWPIKGMYLPDAIANYSVNGTTYFVTANEGDAREYDAFEEEVKIGDIVLDPTVFPNQEFLQRDENLGKINMTSEDGDLDGDGDFDEIHVFGGRSFSIFNGTTGDLVYDSGSDFERIIEEDPIYSAIFNTTNDENELKNRSDNKGPEPEAVIIEEIGGEFYAFVALERVGGFMVYNVSDPAAPIFEGYFNNRSTDPGSDIVGDLAPESLVYVSPENNAEEKGLLVIANEVSSTISVYVFDNVILSTPGFDASSEAFVVFPNPVYGEFAFFKKPTGFVLFDMQGRKIGEAKNATHINVGSLATGTYIVKNDEGNTQKLIVR